MRARKAAFFDIDGTIFRSSLLIEVTEAMVREKIFPPQVAATYTQAFRNWLDRTGTYEEYIHAVVVAFEENLKGVHIDDFLRVSRAVVAFHKNRVYRFTRDLVADLKRRGYFLVAISNSPKEILDEFCGTLGFDKVYGRVYALDEKGKMTGETLHLDLIRDKAKILRRAVERNDLTLNGSVGVGDTESDISFLRLVDKAYCFNPNSKLYKRARRSGWKIMVERKDVIYDL